MPKCRYCGENITRFDKEVCPYCGKEKPIDENSGCTSQITQTLATVSEDEVSSFKDKSKVKAALLCIFLGIFGVDEFYLGFKVKGFAKIAITAVMVGGVGSMLCFLTPLSFYGYLITFGAVFLLNVVLGLTLLGKRTIKDSKGAHVR